MNNEKPTGCYKCGRPGHWSRDCPSSAPINSSNTNSAAISSSSATRPSSVNFNSNSNTKPGGTGTGSGSGGGLPKKSTTKKVRPKLTPQLLLSDDGLGYILRYFPHNFKYHGRGHEVNDLGNLLCLYGEWHSRLLPYYSFDQFVHKVEQVAATKRVKTTIKDLRERVASGGDPTKLHEPPIELNEPTDEQVPAEVVDTEGLNHHQSQDPADDVRENMLHEFYEKSTEEPSQGMPSVMVAADELSVGNSGASNGASSSSEFQITEEQRSRMEANRLKALERAAARARSRQAC